MACSWLSVECFHLDIWLPTVYYLNGDGAIASVTRYSQLDIVLVDFFFVISACTKFELAKVVGKRRSNLGEYVPKTVRLAPSKYCSASRPLARSFVMVRTKQCSFPGSSSVLDL